ncbi:MAG: lysine exporter protein [Flaviaesturariibacter sp.]|nr:lysine exporter protein [Flaviaesturariibacter sp.]
MVAYALIKGLTLGLLLSIAVGPILFTIIKQSINNGVKGGLAFVAGVSLSDIALAVAANLFTELFNSLIERKEIVGITGSIFLISVGVYFLFFKKVAVNKEGKQQLSFRKRDYLKLVITGFFMNILNPAIILFWLATSTTFAEDSLNQRILIFSIALVLVFVSDLAKVFLANRIRQRLTLKNIQLISRLNGAILIGFGVVLLCGLLFFSDKLPQG